MHLMCHFESFYSAKLSLLKRKSEVFSFIGDLPYRFLDTFSFMFPQSFMLCETLLQLENFSFFLEQSLFQRMMLLESFLPFLLIPAGQPPVGGELPGKIRFLVNPQS